MTRPILFRTALALTAALFAAPAMSQTRPADVSLLVDPGRAAVEAFAVAIDANRDGRISPAELDTAGRAVFASMDTDADSVLTRDEMAGWEHGMSRLAAFRGRTQAYEASVGLVFDLFDRDRSDTIDADEHADGIRAALAQADRDGDGAMSLAEFRDEFVMTAAVRDGLAG